MNDVYRNMEFKMQPSTKFVNCAVEVEVAATGFHKDMGHHKIVLVPIHVPLGVILAEEHVIHQVVMEHHNHVPVPIHAPLAAPYQGHPV